MSTTAPSPAVTPGTTSGAPRPSVRHRRPGGRRDLLALVATGALTVGLAACGSSGSSSTTTTAARTTTTTSAATSTTGGSSPTTSAPPTTAAGTASCTTSSLAVTFGSPNGTAGAVHYTLTFRNTGSTTCTLFGYPGVSFLDAGGHQIGAPAQRQGGTPATVTVGTGTTVYSSVAVTDPGIPPCAGGTTAAQVQVYPPGETHAALVTAPSGLQVCSSPNTPAYLSSTVTPVSATAT